MFRCMARAVVWPHRPIANVRTLTSDLALRNGGSYYHRTSDRPLIWTTVGHLVDRAAEKFSERFAFVDRHQGLRKTFLEFKNDVDQLAAGFLALHLSRGDRIAIWSPNRYEWTLTQMAAAKAGLILTTINPAFQHKEIEYCIKKLSIRAVVISDPYKSQDYYKILCETIPEIRENKINSAIHCKRYPFFDTLITLGKDNLPGTWMLEDVMKMSGSKEKTLLSDLQSKLQSDEPINIQFTSGTTGHPKAATLSHFGIINNSMDISTVLGFFDKSHRICANVPLFHCFGCVGVNSAALVSGATVVYPAPGFVPEQSLKAIEEEECTCIYGTPTMFVDLLHHPNLPKTNCSSIEVGVMGGALCPPELLKTAIEKLKCPGLVVAYGSTELSPVMTFQERSTETEVKQRSVGKALPNTEVKIISKNGHLVPFGTPGEICCRGYQVMLGYWDDEQSTKEVMRNGWYHTGDIGILLEDGTLTVLGRIKEMIIRGGENIYPKEIEDFLLTNAKIIDAYVFGVPDQRLGEDICAWVKIRANEIMSEDELKRFCKGKIAHFKIPRHVRFVDDFPKTASGKVQKFKMQEEMKHLLFRQPLIDALNY